MKNQIALSKLQPIIKVDIKCNQVPMLIGLPGIGKSAVLKKLGEQLKTKVFVLSLNHIATREDLTGARMVKDETSNNYKQVFFPHATIQAAIDYANKNPDKESILFLDEINRTTTDVTSAVMALITERKMGTTELPENVRLVAAGNDSGNVNVMDLASNSRVQIFPVYPDLQGFYENEPNLNPFIKKILDQNPKLLVQIPNDEENSIDDEDELENEDDNNNESIDAFLNDDDDNMIQITVPRTLHYMSNILNSYNLNGKNIPDNISDIYDMFETNTEYEQPLKIIIQGTIGNTEMGNKLYNEIITSLNELANQNNNNKQTQINMNNDLKNTIYNNIKSDDDFDKYLINHANQYSKEEFINTYIYLIQPENYKNIQYPMVLTNYYQKILKLLESNKSLKDEFITNMNNLIRDQNITINITDKIKQRNDEISNILKQTLDIFKLN